MAKRQIAGSGGKKPLLNISIGQLELDPMNPRLPEEFQGKSEEELMYALYKFFDTDELAFSMAENGYFDEEPLVAIPSTLPDAYTDKKASELEGNTEYESFLRNPSTKFTVLEGNRRLATIKILLSEEFQIKYKIRSLPTLTSEILEDISIIPTIIYPSKKEVLPYLGVRHISGIKKWEPYAKARYIARMVEEGYNIDSIQQQVGDRSNSARKIYLCYQIVEQYRDEFDLATDKAENYFSYLMLAIGQGAVKDFLGLPKKLENIDLSVPVPNEKVQNLKNLFSWLFGEETNKLPVISESRDITNKLSPVLRNSSATVYLEQTRSLNDAYERSNGEEEMLLKSLAKANSSLENSLSLISRHKTEQVKLEIIKITSTLNSLQTLLNS